MIKILFRMSWALGLMVAATVMADEPASATGRPPASAGNPALPESQDTGGQAASATEPLPTGTIAGEVTIDAPHALVPPNLSHVVVYLASHPKLDPPWPEEGDDKPPPFDERPQIGQKNKAFIPDFLVVPLGTWVEFPNWDHFSHNVFSRSAAAPPFDLDRYPHGQSKSYQFVKVGVVQVFCNIHPRMRATVVVTPSKYFARADAQGRFTIPDVPEGAYELVVWHPRCDEHRQAVVVEDGKDAPLAITLARSVRRILADTHRKHRPTPTAVRGLAVKREQLNLPVVEDAHPACCGPDSDAQGGDETEERREPES